MFDAVLKTNAIEDIRSKEAPGGSFTVLGQTGEGHAIMGQHFMYFVRKGRHDVSEEGCTVHFPGALVELDVGELRYPIDGEEHDELAIHGSAVR
jgi:hypothetical protein